MESKVMFELSNENIYKTYKKEVDKDIFMI